MIEEICSAPPVTENFQFLFDLPLTAQKNNKINEIFWWPNFSPNMVEKYLSGKLAFDKTQTIRTYPASFFWMISIRYTGLIFTLF